MSRYMPSVIVKNRRNSVQVKVDSGSHVVGELHCVVLLLYLLTADDGEDQRRASRTSRSSSDTSLRRFSVDSTFSTSEFDDSGTADNSTVSAGDTSFSGADGQSSSEEQTGGDMSPFAVPTAAATKDPVRLKCREMLSAALKTPREFFIVHFCVQCNSSENTVSP